MGRIRGASTRRSLRGFLAAGRRLQPARHRRLRMKDIDVFGGLLEEFGVDSENEEK